MVDEDDGSLESRPPTLEDLVELCRNLNNRQVRYVVVGGMAIMHHGFTRGTEDIDLLVEDTLENELKLHEALMYLPDQAIREIKPGELHQYSVIRIADEIVVDLMRSACGVDYNEAKNSIVFAEIQGVRIPFASLELLWKLKRTVREKDRLDKIFIQEKLAEQKNKG